MKRFLLLVFVFLNIIACAQITFKRQFGTNGGGEGFSAPQTYDNGYIIHAEKYISQKFYIWLIRTNENGDTLWTKTFCNSLIRGSSDHSVVQCPDSGFAVIGYRNATVYLLRLTKDGDSLWGSDLGRGYAHALEITGNNDFIITGWDTAFLFIKASSNGELLLHKNVYVEPLGATGKEEGLSIKSTYDSGYIIGGYHDWGGEDPHIIICKINSEGDLLWKMPYPSFYSAYCFSIDCTSDRGYILGGNTFQHSLIIKTDSIGNIQWFRRDTSYYLTKVIYGVHTCTDGNYVAVGATDDSIGYQHVLFMKFSTNGKILWSRNFLSGVDVYGNSVFQTSDGGFIICGAIQENDTSSVDVILMKTDSTGEVSWIKNVYKAPLFYVYPNPASDYITIESHEKTRDAEIELFDLNGNSLVKSSLKPFQDKTTIYIGSLKPGEYLLKISGNNKTYLVKKVVKV
jgi:hypothetical protein